MDIQIKKATPKHCSAILRIAKEGGLFNYTHLFYVFLITMGWLYVLIDESVAVGYICYLNFPIIKKVFTLQIGVTESYRGQGLGTKMLDFLCQEVKRRHNVDAILAHTLKPRVVRLFKRQSWKVVASTSIFRIFSIFLVKKKIRQ